jgi:putative transcriptional regulator
MSSVAGSLAPGLLIAPPPLIDPNFDRTVVLLAVHNEGGALGFVINRPAPMALGELLGHAGYQGWEDERSLVLAGGPVQPGSVWILSSEGGPPGADTIAVGDRLRISSTRGAFDELVRELTEGRPRRRQAVLGYSGWGPGQLESEMAAGAWLPVELDEAIVLDIDLATKWERAYALLGLSPAGSINMRGGGEA